MDAIFHAELETEHYHFEAFGTTEARAMDALRKGVVAHLRPDRLSVEHFWEHYSDSVFVHEVRAGACYRDGSRIAG